MKRDANIESGRAASLLLIKKYEQDVQKADNELKELETQPIVLSQLDNISKLQVDIKDLSMQLKGLAPVLNFPGRVDKKSRESVDAFNRSVRSYNKNIYVYQSQMAELNGVIGIANKQYEISVVKSSKLDRASLSTDKKFMEIIGLAQAPLIQPSVQVEQINQGIAARYDKQKSIRDEWNSQASKINGRNAVINSLHDDIYKLYGTTMGGIKIERANNLKTGY